MKDHEARELANLIREKIEEKSNKDYSGLWLIIPRQQLRNPIELAIKEWREKK